MIFCYNVTQETKLYKAGVWPMIKIAMAQLRITPGHPSVNTEKMLSFIQEAKESHADLIIFPEMSIPGYLLGDTWEQRAFIKDCEECGQDIIDASKDIAIIFGNVAVDWDNKNNDGRPRKFNALFTAYKGKLVKPDNMPYPFVIKALMPNYREFDDTRHFLAWKNWLRNWTEMYGIWFHQFTST